MPERSTCDGLLRGVNSGGYSRWAMVHCPILVYYHSIALKTNLENRFGWTITKNAPCTSISKKTLDCHRAKNGIELQQNVCFQTKFLHLLLQSTYNKRCKRIAPQKMLAARLRQHFICGKLIPIPFFFRDETPAGANRSPIVDEGLTPAHSSQTGRGAFFDRSG